MSPDQPPAARLHVVVTDQNGRPLHASGLAKWLDASAPRRARGEVTVALVGDATMRRLNRRYAGHDYATDVLSFPETNPAEAASRNEKRNPAEAGSHDKRTEARHLGDIAIATGVARRQAREAGHPLSQEVRVLALHGLLHLLGYDHETDGGAMARVERRLRVRAGLEHGLLERGGGVTRGFRSAGRKPASAGLKTRATGRKAHGARRGGRS